MLLGDLTAWCLVSLLWVSGAFMKMCGSWGLIVPLVPLICEQSWLFFTGLDSSISFFGSLSWNDVLVL